MLMRMERIFAFDKSCPFSCATIFGRQCSLNFENFSFMLMGWFIFVFTVITGRVPVIHM